MAGKCPVDPDRTVPWAKQAVASAQPAWYFHTLGLAQYRAGQQKTFGFLVGQVMKGSGGKANPKLANELLKRELQQT